VIQVIEGLETKDGVQVRHIVKTASGTFWSVKLLCCGHKQLARHSDLIAEVPVQCAACSKAVTAKANGVETDAQFLDWKARKSIRLPRALPVIEITIKEGNL